MLFLLLSTLTIVSAVPSTTGMFDFGALKDIWNTHSLILSHSSPDDILVFVGNEGAYFYHAFDDVIDNRDTVLIPIDELLATRPAEYEDQVHYSRVFLDPIIKRSKDKSIVLIAHTKTASTIEELNRLIKTRCMNCKTEYIGLVHDSESHLMPKNIHSRVIAPIHSVDFLGKGHDLPRLMNDHPSFMWDLSSASQVNPKAVGIEAEEASELIKAYRPGSLRYSILSLADTLSKLLPKRI